MGNVLGNNKTLKEQVREQKRVIDRSIRSLERERSKLEQNEKKLVIDIKNMAKKNQIKAVQIQAKDLIRLRNNNTKFLNLIANLRAISMQLTTMQSTQTMTDSMKAIGKSMSKLNKTMNLPQLTQIMQEFQKQSELMGMKQDMIGDSLDDAFDTVDDEAESDKVVQQVLDELGVQMEGDLVSAPTGKNAVPATTTTTAKPAEDTLEARMNNLK